MTKKAKLARIRRSLTNTNGRAWRNVALFHGLVIASLPALAYHNDKLLRIDQKVVPLILGKDVARDPAIGRIRDFILGTIPLINVAGQGNPHAVMVILTSSGTWTVPGDFNPTNTF